ncbi:hypothetical protein NUSPORA_01191 [Nucleospora cyclopteri]
MKAFVLQFLKCRKCNSTKIHKLNATKSIEIDFNNNNSDHLLKRIQERENFENDLINISENFKNFSEGDIYEFVENPTAKSIEKIKKMLFGIEIVEGSIFCAECNYESKITDGILNCLDE